MIPQISYETPSKDFFVQRDGKGVYSVLKNGITCAEVVKTFTNIRNHPQAFSDACKHADRLEAIKHGVAS